MNRSADDAVTVRKRGSRARWSALAFCLLVAHPIGERDAMAEAAPNAASAAEPESLVSESRFWTETDSTAEVAISYGDQAVQLRAPYGDRVLSDVDVWRAREGDVDRFDLLVDHNRVDRFRLGVGYQVQSPDSWYPRLGARLEYAFDRKRGLYGIQIEQPLRRRAQAAIGISALRYTDHPELQQVGDVENSLALLFGRQDYRDYFEREGVGAYAVFRIPEVTALSVHVRNDKYRSLALNRGTRSFFLRDRELRINPPVDEGEAHSVILRAERQVRPVFGARAGLYHWIDLEKAGHARGGNFEYSRLLADVRSIMRVHPTVTVSFRMLVGHTWNGRLPIQKHFTLGGVDGLRAHSFSTYRGDQAGLLQTECTVGLWRVRSGLFEGGLYAIGFIDAGRAWFNPDHGWDLNRQHVQSDGGLGITTSEDNLRLYFAKNLRDPDSEWVLSLRLQRPF